MKTSKILLVIASLSIASALMVSSCKKKEKEIDSDTSAASDNNYAETIANDIANIGDQAGNSNNASGNSLSTYKTINDNNAFMLTCVQSITRDTVNKIIVVDFGTTASTCQDGRTRSGQLKFTYTGGVHYRDSGVVITVTPINYTVDGNAVSGTKTITNLGRIGGNFKWNITANISIVKAGGGGTISWSCNRTKELLNTSVVYTGAGNPISWLQAKIGITGTANGTTAAGNNYTASTTSQLVRDFTCVPANSPPHRHPFIAGGIDFSPDNKPTRHIDFGNSTCDDDATVTINGNTFNIKLH
ncbi:MAG: hypothetical protein ACJ76F_09125 [Bacteroidia bacterium]